MTKKDREKYESKRDIIDEMYREHQKRAEAFDDQPGLIAYCCFIWPDLAKWQAVAAYEGHRQLIPAAERVIREARIAYGDSNPTRRALIGDAVNVAAAAVLINAEGPMLGGLIAFVAESLGPFFIAELHDTRRDGNEGSLCRVKAMPACVTTVDEARIYIGEHPLVQQAKRTILENLPERPKV